MKKIFTTAIVIAAFAASAGERENLLKKFEREYAVAQTEFLKKANTTVELVGSAGECATLSEKHLFQAFDYKLRHTASAEERLQIIADFHKLSKELQTLHQTPREGMGSLAGMQIYHAEANLMRRQIAIWMLDPETEKRWNRMANVPFILNGKSIELDRGKAKFDAVMYGRKVTLEILLSPQNTFTYQNRDFAIIRTDIPFAGNDDFSTVYLCEFDGKKLQVHTKCKFPLLCKWKVTGKTITIFTGNKKEKIQF